MALNFSSIWDPNQIKKHVIQSIKTTPETSQQLLKKQHYTIADLPALIAPETQSYLHELAKKSHIKTMQRFGKIMQLYIPLYLSNSCINHCAYCGFAHNQKAKRKTLTDHEIKTEADLIYQKGFQHILLLTGEDSKSAGIPYIAKAITQLRPQFAAIGLEIYPLDQSGYETLIQAGADTLTIYQETYHESTYRIVHPKGPKRNFMNRLSSPEHAGNAGFYQINIGALLGLYDWRFEALALAHHLAYLQKKYWRTKWSVSFPRIQKAVKNFKPADTVSDCDLRQLIIAFRLIFPDIGITLSTRESAKLRNQLIPLGVTMLSAESHTAPGSYSGKKTTSQFKTADNRSLKEVQNKLKQLGYDPILKDWDKGFNHHGLETSPQANDSFEHHLTSDVPGSSIEKL